MSLSTVNVLIIVIVYAILTYQIFKKKYICLAPRESETREVKSLDGVWNFVKSSQLDPLQGVHEKWFDGDLSAVQATMPMPVPASYNDVTVDRELRYHVGTVWYDRRFFVPNSWSQNQRVWIRFGSVHYAAQVVRVHFSCKLELL